MDIKRRKGSCRGVNDKDITAIHSIVVSLSDGRDISRDQGGDGEFGGKGKNAGVFCSGNKPLRSPSLSGTTKQEDVISQALGRGELWASAFIQGSQT